MKLITERDKIRGVAEAWKRQYFHCNNRKWGGTLKRPSTEEVYSNLLALDTKTATPEDVAKIIGNGSWARLTCNDCRKDVKAVVECGEEPDYESSTANLCVDCLKVALGLLEGAK